MQRFLLSITYFYTFATMKINVEMLKQVIGKSIKYKKLLTRNSKLGKWEYLLSQSDRSPFIYTNMIRV